MHAACKCIHVCMCTHRQRKLMHKHTANIVWPWTYVPWSLFPKVTSDNLSGHRTTFYATTISKQQTSGMALLDFQHCLFSKHWCFCFTSLNVLKPKACLGVNVHGYGINFAIVGDCTLRIIAH